MKLFLRGGMSLIAALFAVLLISYARPLFAEVNPSPQPAATEQQEQQKQEKQEHAPVAAQPKKETEATSEKDSLSDVVTNSTPAGAEVKSTENLIAAAPQIYNATSYSRPGRGASGMGVRFGTIAADPKLLPFGTRVRIDAGQYSGEYTVTDAGTAIRGRKIDIWLPTYREACRFGRRNVKLTVLSYGGKRTLKRAQK